ncbi:MAG: CHRD domain-containing protein, partial [Pyrinomonadaceae bacterium]
MRNRFLSIFAAAIFVASLSANVNAETFYAYLNGAQEVPAVATSATGYARVVVNEAAGTLTFTVVFNNLSSAQTASHIHAPAPLGANAAVVINFGAVGGTSGTITGSASITPTQLAQIRQHLGYV